jgi:anaerobic selenocysteine-containing dehydrogenase
MDTLEHRTDVDKEGKRVTVSPPILWRGKTARQIYQERFFSGDYKFERLERSLPKSTIPDAEYCQVYTVFPQKEQKNTGYYTYSTLTELPEKK